MPPINCEHHRDLCKELYHPEPVVPTPESAVPEPGTYILMMVALVGLALWHMYTKHWRGQ